MSEQRGNTYKKKARKWDPNIKIWTSGDKILQSTLAKCYTQSLTFHKYTVSTRKEGTGTFSLFVLIQVFSHRETLGNNGQSTITAHLRGSGQNNRDIIPWMWKMSTCLEMQTFFVAPWSTRWQTKNTQRTLWRDFFKLVESSLKFGVLWHCCNPNCVPQGREEILP